MIKKSGIKFFIVCSIAFAFGLSALSVKVLRAQEEKAEEKVEKKEDKTVEVSAEKEVIPAYRGTSNCIADPAVLDDLKKRREEIDQKMKELSARDVELKARERAIDEEIKKLTLLRDGISTKSTLVKKENEEKISRLVETFESMSPKACAQVISNLDEQLAVVALSKMNTQKLAKVMTMLDAQKSAKLTELLAGVSRATKASSVGRNSTSKNDVAVDTEKSVKGGEKNDGNK